MSKFIVGAASNGIYEALHAAGVIADDPNNVARCIIDLQVGSPAKVYVETFADDSLTKVILSGGLAIVDTAEGAA